MLVSSLSPSWEHKCFRHLHSLGLFKSDQKVYWMCFFIKKAGAQDICLHSRIPSFEPQRVIGCRSCYWPCLLMKFSHIRRILGCLLEHLPSSFGLLCWLCLVICLFVSESSTCSVYYYYERLHSLKSSPSSVSVFKEHQYNHSVL